MHLFSQIPSQKNDWIIHRDVVFERKLPSDFISSWENLAGENRDFYLPDRDEILDIRQNGYPSQNPWYQKAEDYLLTSVGLTQDETSDILESIWDTALMTGSFQELLNRLRLITNLFDHPKSAPFIPLLKELNDHTHKFANLGYSNAALREKAGVPRIHPTGIDAASSAHAGTATGHSSAISSSPARWTPAGENLPQRSLPLRQRKEVQKMLREITHPFPIPCQK